MFGLSLLPRNLEASFRDLGSSAPATRVSAIRDVVRHALRDDGVRERATERLKEALDDSSPGVRAAAAVALGDIDAIAAVDALIDRVDDDDDHVRQMALNALGEIGDARCLVRLRRSLTDPRPGMRFQAVIAIARFAERAEVERACRAAADDDDDEVRYIAMRVLEECVERDGPAAWSRTTNMANAMLDDPYANVRVAAAVVLGKLGDARARSRIEEVVRGTLQGAREDEHAAIELAGVFGLESIIPALERRAWGVASWVRDTGAYHAKIALARMGHVRAIDELQRALDSRDADARNAAVVALGRAHRVEYREAIASLADDRVDPALRTRALELLEHAHAQSDGGGDAPLDES